MSLQINQMVRVKSARKAQGSEIRILNRLVLNGKQKCLECGGIGQLVGKRITFLVSLDKVYPHRINCSQIGRF